MDEKNADQFQQPKYLWNKLPCALKVCKAHQFPHVHHTNQIFQKNCIIAILQQKCVS